ncbi:MAG TPA: hypothetical protein PK129_15060, partial [Cellvibrionaceae bacterium]|nr:hypothetical protein [Cellvibrionaceae bacterium]
NSSRIFKKRHSWIAEGLGGGYSAFFMRLGSHLLHLMVFPPITEFGLAVGREEWSGYLKGYYWLRRCTLL